MIQSDPIGIYIHIPFCAQKCPYCDFYSLSPAKNNTLSYIQALQNKISAYQGKQIKVDTIYFGGGTPSLIGAEHLSCILKTIRENFVVADSAEITCEVNPGRFSPNFFSLLKQTGFNRISFGMQSANENELRYLGRGHSPTEVKKAVETAQQSGFDNISVDLMLGIPESSKEHLKQSIDFISTLPIQHVSAYMLKIEKNTPFYAKRKTLPLPDDDGMADLYTYCVTALKKIGFAQYEISNFAHPGKESRHNLKYWHCEEYLGFGPSAHSFYQGKRFYYPRSLETFLTGENPIPDGTGGDFEEFAMLNLRLREGVLLAECQKRFENGTEKFLRMQANVKNCPPHLLSSDRNHIALTTDGFAVSNAVILTLLS